MKKTNTTIINSTYDYFENRNKSLILYNIDCAEQLNNKYNSLYINILINSIMVVSLIILSYILFPYSAIILCGELLVTAVFTKYLNTKINILNKKEINIIQKTREKQYDIINTIQSIKFYGLGREYYSEWEKYFNHNIDKKVKKDIFLSFRTSFNSLIYFVFPTMTIILLSVFNEKLSISLLMSIYAITTLVVSYFTNLVNDFFQLEQKVDYIDRTKDILLQEKEVDGVINLDMIKTITFHNVSFSYSKSSNIVIDNLNLNLCKGDKIAITGKSGAGKSTIAKLLIKLYSPNNGEIRINNINIVKYSNDSIRHKICYITQDNTIANKKIIDNLKIINKYATLKEIEEVCKIVNIYDDIMDMPMKFDTLLSNDYNVLSSGQKQKLVIAQSLLSNFEVFILDEATNCIDTSSEEKIIMHLLNTDKTVFYISHRDSLINKFDKIIQIKN